MGSMCGVAHFLSGSIPLIAAFTGVIAKPVFSRLRYSCSSFGIAQIVVTNSIGIWRRSLIFAYIASTFLNPFLPLLLKGGFQNVEWLLSSNKGKTPKVLDINWGRSLNYYTYIRRNIFLKRHTNWALNFKIALKMSLTWNRIVKLMSHRLDDQKERKLLWMYI